MHTFSQLVCKQCWPLYLLIFQKVMCYICFKSSTSLSFSKFWGLPESLNPVLFHFTNCNMLVPNTLLYAWVIHCFLLYFSTRLNINVHFIFSIHILSLFHKQFLKYMDVQSVKSSVNFENAFKKSLTLCKRW